MRILLLLTAVILIAVVELANGNEFEIHFKNENACNAGAPVGNKKVQGKSIVYNSKFRVLDAYIYWTNGNGKIIRMAVCNVPASTGCTADKVPSKGAAKVYLVLSVTLQKSSFEDQNIHYQYFDEYFELSKLDSPSTADQKIHQLNDFLFPVSAKYKTDKADLIFTGNNCRHNLATSVISGHGYFITEFKKNDGTNYASWDNLYYLPHRIGQYITTPN